MTVKRFIQNPLNCEKVKRRAEMMLCQHTLKKERGTSAI